MLTVWELCWQQLQHTVQRKKLYIKETNASHLTWLVPLEALEVSQAGPGGGSGHQRAQDEQLHGEGDTASRRSSEAFYTCLPPPSSCRPNQSTGVTIWICIILIYFLPKSSALPKTPSIVVMEVSSGVIHYLQTMFLRRCENLVN